MIVVPKRKIPYAASFGGKFKRAIRCKPTACRQCTCCCGAMYALVCRLCTCVHVAYVHACMSAMYMRPCKKNFRTYVVLHIFSCEILCYICVLHAFTLFSHFHCQPGGCEFFWARVFLAETSVFCYQRFIGHQNYYILASGILGITNGHWPCWGF